MDDRLDAEPSEDRQHHDVNDEGTVSAEEATRRAEAWAKIRHFAKLRRQQRERLLAEEFYGHYPGNYRNGIPS